MFSLWSIIKFHVTIWMGGVFYRYRERGRVDYESVQRSEMSI